MRITAGTLRNRRIVVPDEPDIRPTPSKVRQALFNIISHQLDAPLSDCHMLDLYAGSGVMALEAISRGMSTVTSIDGNKRACRSMQQGARALAVSPDTWNICHGHIPDSLKPLQGRYFHLIFADPPYHKGESTRLPGWLMQQHITFDLLIIEEASSAEADWSDSPLQPFMVRRYGSTTLYLFHKESS